MGRRGRVARAAIVIGATLAAGAAVAAMTDAVTVGEHADRSTTRRSVSIVAGGEIIAESAVRNAAAAAAQPGTRFDFTPLMAPLAATIASADLAICHLELPIGRPAQQPGNIGHSPFGGNRLLAPYELAAGVAATGFDRCSTASNHSDDAGTSGVASTLDALDAAGVSHAGTARSYEERAAQVQPIVVEGVHISHLAYTRGSNNVELSGPWVNYSPSVADVVGDVQAARAAGAELVVVSVHVLPELNPFPAASDRAFITRVTATVPIDLVVMHGAHVVQPPELVHGSPVFWGLGNMLSGMGVPSSGPYVDPRTLDSVLAAVEFTEAAPHVFTPQVWAVLACVDPATRTVWPGIAALADPATPSTMHPVLASCAARTRQVVNELS